MKVSRREFVAAGLAGAASFCAGGYAIPSNAAEAKAQLLDEDGSKLWLRYAPPGNAAKSHGRIVRQIRVDGTSATSGIIRDELRLATAAMLGRTVPLNENGFEA